MRLYISISFILIGNFAFSSTDENCVRLDGYYLTRASGSAVKKVKLLSQKGCQSVRIKNDLSVMPHTGKVLYHRGPSARIPADGTERCHFGFCYQAWISTEHLHVKHSPLPAYTDEDIPCESHEYFFSLSIDGDLVREQTLKDCEDGTSGARFSVFKRYEEPAK